MHDLNGGTMTTQDTRPSEPSIGSSTRGEDVVSTHVLVAEEQVEKLRELSRRTRVAQSEYLREAIDDLLSKYESKAAPK
jgi:Ribbon-helix-helix domain